MDRRPTGQHSASFCLPPKPAASLGCLHQARVTRKASPGFPVCFTSPRAVFAQVQPLEQQGHGRLFGFRMFSGLGHLGHSSLEGHSEWRMQKQSLRGWREITNRSWEGFAALFRTRSLKLTVAHSKKYILPCNSIQIHTHTTEAKV